MHTQFLLSEGYLPKHRNYPDRSDSLFSLYPQNFTFRGNLPEQPYILPKNCLNI